METLSIVVIIAVLVVFLAVIGLKIYSSIKLKGLRQTAIDLICKAEEEYEKGKNDEKFKIVVNGLLSVLPSPAKIFLNESTINYFVQSVFDSIKVALDTKAKENTVEK